MGAMFSIMTLLNMPVWGMIMGSQPIIGFNYGAKNYNRVRQDAITTELIEVVSGAEAL